MIITSQTILDQLLSDTYIHSEVLRRLKTLREFLANKMFGPDNPLPESYPKDLEWVKKLDPSFLNEFNKDNLSLLDETEKFIKSLEQLIIYLPSELPELEVIKLGQYLRNAYQNNFLFEIKIDPTLIGGCALVWKGVYKDYSLRQKLTDNREPILKMLKEYV